MRLCFSFSPLDIARFDKPKAEFLFGLALLRLKIPALICKKPPFRAFILKIIALTAALIPIPLFPESRYMKATDRKVDGFGVGAHWVVVSKLTAETGYTDDAARSKQRRGIWKEGVHWRKAPDHRVVFNLVAIQAWMGGQHA